MISEEQVLQIKERYSLTLLRERGVTGVGTGQDENGNPVLLVLWDPNYPDTPSRLPKQIEGCPVKAIPGGPFQKLSAESKPAE